MMNKSDEELAKEIHNAYEKYSKNANWKTQKKCRVGFQDLPEENQIVMISIARLVKQWSKEAINKKLQEIRSGNRVTVKRYDDAYGYDLDEDYYKV